MSDIRIGDEVYIHGFVDEVRKDVVIIKNEGGYFGTVADEIMPSAQPERKRGKWIYGEDEYGIDGYHCDKCGFFVPWDYAHKFINYIKDYNLCPNCGARMI